MEAFIAGYLECMLWLTTDEDGEPIHGIEVHPDSMVTIRNECADFYNANRATWERGGWNDNQAGHDFHLTRNGHGTGFWDRSYNDETDACGEILTANCRPYGEQDLYQGDDGEYHV